MSDPWAEFREAPVKKVSQAVDIGMSLLSGGQQGGAQFLGLPGDAIAFTKGLMQKGVGAAEARGFAPKGSGEVLAKALKDGPAQGPINIPTPSTLARILMSGGGAAVGVKPETMNRVLAVLPKADGAPPTTKDVETFVGNPKYHKPQTVPGEYARTLGQFAPGALMPGSLLVKGANVVVPALTSETAGQMTKGSKAEPYARVLGALLGAGGVQLAASPRPGVRMLAEAARGSTDDQITAAQALREQAAARGVTLTQAEAIQQVAGGSTGMGRLQRVLEGTQAGSERITPVMSQRPEQVRGAVKQFADNISPPTQNPSMIGAQAQTAADEALTGVRKGINAEADPFYKALETQNVAPEVLAPLRQNPAYAHALEQVRSHPILGAPLRNLPDENLSVINEVVKHLDTLGENARPGPMNPNGNNQLAAAFGDAAGQARQIAASASPEWTQARDIVSSGRAAQLEPLQRGPLGAISATDSVPGQTRALFPSAPLEGAANETERAVQMLMQQNPEVPPGLIRQHVMNTMNEATQNLQAGPNQWGGAKFAATIAGNPEQAATLRAGIDAAAPGQGAQFDELTRVLAATGKRQAPGSMTAYNMEDLKKLGETGALGQVASTGLNPPGVFRKLGDAFFRYNVERNAGQLAEAILAEPARATELIREARRVVPAGRQLQQLEALAVAAGQGRRAETLPAVRP